MAKTLYLNLEDDVKKVADKIRAERSSDLVLVFPKQSYLFSDGVNLKMLKKQTDLLGKKIAILTMDERGQIYAKDAGFELKSMPGSTKGAGLGDIRVQRPQAAPKVEPEAYYQVPAPALELPKKTVNNPKEPAKQIKVNSAPKTPQATGSVIPKIEVRDTIFPDISPEAKLLRHSTDKRSYYNKVLIGAVALGLIVIVLLATVILPHATVSLYAKADPIARDIEVTLSSESDEPDSSRLILPAESIDTTLEARETFTAYGKKEIGSKAEGKVRVYNFSSTPLNLKAGTTALTHGGKKYVFTQDQNGIKVLKQSQATDPNAGHLAVIQAESGGGNYNLPTGTRLEITNQVFGSKPQFLYARTEGEITGGNSRYLSIISEEDLAKAKKTMSDSLVEQIRNRLKEKDMILPDTSYTAEVVSFTTDKPVNTETTNFEASIQVRIRAVGFSENMLTELLRARIQQMLPQNKKLQPVSDDVVSYKIRSVDPTAGTGSLVAHFESKALDIVETSDVAASISGKSKEEASEVLLSRPEISKVDITLSPAWQNSLPRFSSKIKVEQK